VHGASSAEQREQAKDYLSRRLQAPSLQCAGLFSQPASPPCVSVLLVPPVTGPKIRGLTREILKKLIPRCLSTQYGRDELKEQSRQVLSNLFKMPGAKRDMLVKKAVTKFKDGGQKRRDEGTYGLGGGGFGKGGGGKGGGRGGKATNAAALIYGRGGNDDDSSDED